MKINWTTIEDHFTLLTCFQKNKKQKLKPNTTFIRITNTNVLTMFHGRKDARKDVLSPGTKVV